MVPAEVEWLSCHLGHDVAIHKKSFRQQTNAIEMTKVAPLLNMIDSNAVNRQCSKMADKGGLSITIHV